MLELQNSPARQTENVNLPNSDPPLFPQKACQEPEQKADAEAANYNQEDLRRVSNRVGDERRHGPEIHSTRARVKDE